MSKKDYGVLQALDNIIFINKSKSENKRGKNKKKKGIMGRPRKEVNWKQFEQLCNMQCTEVEIANFFDMTDDTLNTRCKEHYKLTFSDIYSKKRSNGKASLRRVMWKNAMKGNNTMMVWLSKNYLNMTDKREDTIKETNFDVELID